MRENNFPAPEAYLDRLDFIDAAEARERVRHLVDRLRKAEDSLREDPEFQAYRMARRYIRSRFQPVEIDKQRPEYIAIEVEYDLYCDWAPLLVDQNEFASLMLGIFPGAKTEEHGKAVYGLKRRFGRYQ
jgi:hypothetical protein